MNDSRIDTERIESMEPGCVELRCGMCDGTGVEVGKDYACSWCDGLTTVEAHLDGRYVPAVDLAHVEAERDRYKAALEAIHDNPTYASVVKRIASEALTGSEDADG